MKIRDVFGDLPEIETERLLLRKMMADDAGDVFDYASDPQVARYVIWDTHRSIRDSESFLELVVEGYRNGELGNWGMVDKESGKLIGTCGYDSSWSPVHARAEIGYALSRQHWGRGLMPEAVTALLKFGFGRMKLNRIVARCFSQNTASEKVMRKVGMTYEGTLREYLYLKGDYQDLKVYSILRSEYRTG
ncbi:MAG: GNAT family N-acetyltransferase [Rubrobacteraceae bacterium]